MVRCKFICSSAKKYSGWRNDLAKQDYLGEYEFSPVSTGSEENKKFFQSTPSGSFRIGGTLPDLFVAGKEYYFDITEAAAQ